MTSFLLGRNPRAALTRVAALVVSAYVVFGYILLPIRLQGISMLPAYGDGQINFANRLAYTWRAPERGDAVAIRMAGPSVVYVKRIVALPGERVEIEKGVVKINGGALVEPNVVSRAPWNMAPITLGQEEYFLIGDNRAMSMENHEFGRTTRDRIIGKMLF